MAGVSTAQTSHNRNPDCKQPMAGQDQPAVRQSESIRNRKSFGDDFVSTNIYCQTLV